MNKTLIHSLTGLFLLAALLLAGMAIVAGPTLQGWFGTIRKIEAWLPQAYVAEGNPVEFRSFRVGRVIAVRPHFWHPTRASAWFQVVIAIDREWADSITDAFTLTVNVNPLGALAGTSLVLLAPGEAMTRDAEHPAELRGRTLESIPEDETVELAFQQPESLLDALAARAKELLDQLGPKAEQVLAKADGLIQQLASDDGDLFTFVRELRGKAEGLQQPIDDVVKTVAEVRKLVEGLNDPSGSVQQILAHAAAVTAAIERGEGVVGGLLREGEIKQQTVELMQRTNALLEETRAILVQTQSTLRDVNESSSSFPALVASLVGIVARLDTASRTVPGLAEEVRRALEQSNAVLIGLRESPLLNAIADFAPPPPEEPIVLPASIHPAGG